MFNIKDIRCKPRLRDLVKLEYGRHLARRPRCGRRWAHAPAIHAAGDNDHTKKKRMGLDFYVYMRSCFYSYGAFAPLIIETPQKITPTFTIFVQHGVTTHVL